ncbi:Meiotic nuclear division protein 1 [Mitosporidium daphniae]
MSSRLSFDEKRKRLCDLFYEKKDFFQLRDLEKMAPKLKGIVSQSVKEVLQSLVDDNLVCREKIGSSNYFWSFPSTAIQSRKVQISRLEESVEKIRSSISEMQSKIEEASIDKEETDEYLAFQSQYADLDSQRKKFSEEIDKYKEVDPELFRAKKIEVEEIKKRVNIWIDNIFTLRSYCINNFGTSEADFNAQFEIPDDLDYAD